jgi:hypothetical protein
MDSRSVATEPPREVGGVGRPAVACSGLGSAEGDPLRDHDGDPRDHDAAIRVITMPILVITMAIPVITMAISLITMRRSA